MQRVALLLCPTLLLVTLAPAGEPTGNPVAPAATASPIILRDPASAAPATAVAPTRPRAVSPTTAALLAAATPAYQPPQPKTVSTTAAEEANDKPRNTIIRLPRYVVREPRVPKMSEYQILTPKGKLDLALKAYPGLRFGSFWIFRNDGVALRMLADDVAAERAREIADLTSLLPANEPSRDSEPGRRQSLIRDALAPRSSWTNMSGSTDR